jgi:AraC family transcriptional regulator
LNFVQKAVWFVESHFRETVTLEEIAQTCGVSAYHLTRTFATSMGIPLMRYVRARRLSEAARQLIQTKANIVDVALETGYGSHEAFTRAFRDQFDLTPEQLRAQGHANNITLVEALSMHSSTMTRIQPPRLESEGPRIIAGLIQRHDCSNPAGIPEQWQRFSKWIGNIPGQIGDAAYGINSNFDEEGTFDYMCGVQVSGESTIPSDLKVLKLPAQTYAVFEHAGHIAGIRGSFTSIWNWFSASDLKPTEAPNLEKYGRQFDPATGLGGLEIWIPIQK